VPVAPISPAYSKLSRDHAKLRYVIVAGLVVTAGAAAWRSNQAPPQPASKKML